MGNHQTGSEEEMFRIMEFDEIQTVNANYVSGLPVNGTAAEAIAEATPEATPIASSTTVNEDSVFLSRNQNQNLNQNFNQNFNQNQNQNQNFVQQFPILGATQHEAPQMPTATELPYNYNINNNINFNDMQNINYNNNYNVNYSFHQQQDYATLPHLQCNLTDTPQQFRQSLQFQGSLQPPYQSYQLQQYEPNQQVQQAQQYEPNQQAQQVQQVQQPRESSACLELPVERRIVATRKAKPVLRSRRVCDTCRLKQLKCDKAKPRCGQCVLDGTKCVYRVLLQFKEDVESKGKRFGREGINSVGKLTTDELVLRGKLSHYQQIQHKDNVQFINTHYNDITGEHDQNEAKLLPSLQSSIIPPDVMFLEQQDSHLVDLALKFYLDYLQPILNSPGNRPIRYQQQGLHNAAGSDSNSSFEGQMVTGRGVDLGCLINVTQHNQSLFYFLIGLSSHLLAKTASTSAQKELWQERSQYYKNMGLMEVQPLINQLEKDEPLNIEKVSLIDTLLSLMHVLLFEIADNSNKKWLLYLRLCRKLLSQFRITMSKDSTAYYLLKFSLEFLHYHENVGRTACKDPSLSFLLVTDKLEHDDESSLDDGQFEFITWMGSDKRLIRLISDITDLSFERVRRSKSEKEYLFKCGELKQRLDNLKVYDTNLGFAVTDTVTDTDPNSNPNVDALASTNLNAELKTKSKVDFSDVSDYVLVSEVKRLTTELYMNCCLLNMTPEDDEVMELVKQILELLQLVIFTRDYHWGGPLIWSVFVAAVEISVLHSNCEDLRYTVLQLLDTLEYKTLGNISRTRQIILGVWKKRDLDNSDLHSMGVVDTNSRKFKKRKKFLGFENDWEKYVVDKNYGIALS